MARRRTQHAQITNKRKKNAVFCRRLDGLLKKANELSILCGVDVGIVIHGQGKNNIVQWPSPNALGEMMSKFLQISNGTRGKKMSLHDKYLEQNVSEEGKDLMMSKRRNEAKEYHQLVHEAMEGKKFDEFDLCQLNNLNSFAIEMLKKLQDW